MGPGVIIGVKYATYLISFINHGTKEIDKTDNKLDEIIPEHITLEVETTSSVEKSLLKILRQWSDTTELVPLGDRWLNGMMLLQPADKTQKPKEIPIDVFFHKIVMLRDRLRVMEQQINAHKILTDEDKVTCSNTLPVFMAHLPRLMYCLKIKSNGLWVIREVKKINDNRVVLL